jgi:hypothetical protein
MYEIRYLQPFPRSHHGNLRRTKIFANNSARAARTASSFPVFSKRAERRWRAK